MHQKCKRCNGSNAASERAQHLVSCTNAATCSGIMCHNENVIASLACAFMNLSSTSSCPPSPFPSKMAACR